MTGSPLERLLPFLRRYQVRIFWGTLMVLATNAFAVVSPWILRQTVDMLRGGFDRAALLRYAGLIVGAAVMEGIFRFAMRRILIGVSRDVEYDLRNALFAHLERLPPAFYQQHSTGDLMARSSSDLAAVRTVLGPGIMYSINTLSIGVLALAFLLRISPPLTLLALLPLSLASLAVKKFGAQIHSRSQAIQEQLSSLSTLVQESLAGVRVIRAYHREEVFMDRFRVANQDYFRRNLALARVAGLFHPLNSLFLGLTSVALLWYGGRLVVEARITLGDFVAFLSYLAMLIWPTVALGWVVNLFQRGAASMARINEILNSPPEPDVPGVEPVRLRGEIEVRGLSFAYGDRPVLRSVSFHVPAGSTLGIVGRTAAGKSTLLHLLCRLRRPPAGTVLVDGRDINSLPQRDLRSAFGFVPQDPFLFSESLADNISLGRPEAPAEDVRQAAREAGLEEEIGRFPAGLETLVGERGITLSGGQKQRATIARALLVRPRILILDDALSSVDADTEHRILQGLEGRAGCTRVLVSHRTSAVQDADRILVLDEGSVVEQGTHAELMAQGGLYAELHEKQQLQRELELG